MKRFINVTKDIISDIIYSVLYFIENNLRNFAVLINFALPYLMLFIGQYVYDFRDKYALGGELFVPLIVFFVSYLLNSYANRFGKGISVPIPEKRFTELGDDGEVSIPVDRENEMILYMADLEDWLERKGLL